MKGFLAFELLLYLICLEFGRPTKAWITVLTVTFIACTFLYHLGIKLGTREIYINKTPRQWRLMKEREYGFGNCY